MRFWKSWIVTQKDLSVIRKNKYVFYSLIAMPVILGIVLPVTFVFALNAELASLPHDQFMAAANQLINIQQHTSSLFQHFFRQLSPPTALLEKRLRKALNPYWRRRPQTASCCLAKAWRLSFHASE